MGRTPRVKLTSMLNAFSLLLAITCCGFALYQTVQCIKKYQTFPKLTEVSIAKASKYEYPELTICSIDFSDFSKKLEKCNLTREQYLIKFMWAGNGSDECTDPEQLYLKLAGKPSDLIKLIMVWGGKINGYLELNLEDKELFEMKTFSQGGGTHYSRCFTLKLPKNLEVSEVRINFLVPVYVHLQSSKSSFNIDKSSLMVMGDLKYIKTGILYDIFQVVDLDGQPCGEYENSRDDCLHNEIAKVTRK